MGRRGRRHIGGRALEAAIDRLLDMVLSDQATPVVDAPENDQPTAA